MKEAILNARLCEKKELQKNSEDINDKFPALTKMCLSVIFISAALIGILPQTILGIIILCACVPLINTKDIYLVYPVILFYHLHLGEIFVVPVYTLFSLIFLFFTLLKDYDVKINISFVVPSLLFLVYCLLVIAPYDLNRTLRAIFDSFCIIILITHYLQERTNLKKFFKVFALIALVAFFTGMQVQTSFDSGIIVDGEFVELVRNCATFEDPNYMGFFYTVAIFSVVTLKLFNPKFRVILVIALYAMLLSTLSITAILVNAIMWFLYLVITKKLNLKVLLLVILILAILIGFYFYGSANPDAPIFGMLATRISARFDDVEYVDSDNSDNIGDLTSGRTKLAEIHLDYFMNLPIWRMFVGMNPASTLRTDLDGFRMAAHNEYIDWLLNVGIIGASIMLYYLLKRLFTAFKEYRETESSESLCILFSKLIWIAYAFTLTVYGDFRFLSIFFL